MTKQPVLELPSDSPLDTYDPVVEATNVHKWYQKQHVLDGVTMSVQRGEIAGLIGPSGAGKSTFLRCINHLASHDYGEILIGGREIGIEKSGGKLYRQRESETARIRRKIGMVFQNFNLFGHMTVLENIIYAPVRVLGKNKSDATGRAHQLLRMVQLDGMERRYPHQLSGGQQQRVAIARALAMEPDLMLFDEPTSALDPELVGEVLATIQELASSGMTMMIVTHEMNFVRNLAHKIYFMVDGRIEECGPPDQIFTAPQQERTRKFLARTVSLSE